jgi:putative acetyltransferase
MTTPPLPAPALHLRRGRLADTQGIYELSLRALYMSAARSYTFAELEAWASLRSLAGHQRMIRETFLLVAEIPRGVCGFANLVVETGLVDQLFVDPSAGGRGVATRLLAALEERAVSAGLACLVSHASRRAVDVFEHCGYQRLTVEQVAIGEELLERYRVQKTLSPTPEKG